MPMWDSGVRKNCIRIKNLKLTLQCDSHTDFEPVLQTVKNKLLL